MKLLLPVCALLSLAVPATAQATASTLHRLIRAQAIAEVKVLAIRAEHGTRHVVFKSLRVLKGELPPTFTLTDADGRICGGTLHGLIPGAGRLAFLDHGASGPRLTVPSPRALAPLHPQVREHVMTLLETGTRSPVQVLTRALAAGHPRVRQDAAYALPLLACLRCTADDRERILEALQNAMIAGDKSSASLILAAQRLQLRGAVDTLLPHYLAGTAPGLEPLLVEVMAAVDGDRAARSLLRELPTRPRQQRLALRLLARCEGRDARRCLQRLLLARNDSVRSRAAAALLQRGHPGEDIRKRAGAQVLNAGRHLLRHRKPFQFRSIRLARNH